MTKDERYLFGRCCGRGKNVEATERQYSSTVPVGYDYLPYCRKKPYCSFFLNESLLFSQGTGSETTDYVTKPQLPTAGCQNPKRIVEIFQTKPNPSNASGQSQSNQQKQGIFLRPRFCLGHSDRKRTNFYNRCYVELYCNRDYVNGPAMLSARSRCTLRACPIVGFRGKGGFMDSYVYTHGYICLYRSADIRYG